MISIRLIQPDGAGIPVLTEKSLIDIVKELYSTKKWDISFVTDNSNSFYFPVIYGDVVDISLDGFLAFKKEVLSNIEYHSYIDNDRELNYFLATLYLFFDQNLERSIRWVNSNIKSLGNKIPKENILKNDFKELNVLLGRLEFGVYS